MNATAISGTDLDVNFNLSGGNLVLRINKGGIQIFRAVLRKAAAPMPGGELAAFSPFSPDLALTVGDIEASLAVSGLCLEL